MTTTRQPVTGRGVGLPRVLWIPAALAFALIALPVVGLLLQANWARMPELLLSDSALDALRLSLETAAISTALCIVLGGPLAAVLARGDLPGLPILRSVVLLPLVLPPVVGGLALLFLLGRSGLVGRGARPVVRDHRAVHHGRGGPRADVRGAAVPRRQPGGGAAHGRAALRGRRRDARRLADAGVPAGHRAAGAAGPGVGHGARVRALPRRVRRDHRVRGQPAGHHPHPAAAGVPGARDRRGRGRRAVAGAGRRGGRW